MSLVNVDAKGAAVAGVDEAAKVLPASLEPMLESIVDRLADRLQKLLVGRKITITIE
jgi:hypothetical protein